MMKRLIKFSLIPLIAMGLAAPLSAQDGDEARSLPVPVPTDAATEGDEQELNDTEFGQAVALSQTISTTTGVAMSPMLGMGVLGAWRYFETDAALRGELPWYTLPWVWGLCFGIFVLLKSKDTLGFAVPEIAKKPITVLDDIQEKASAAIVALAVVPTTVLEQFPATTPTTTGDGTLAIAPVIIPVLIIVLCVAVFFVVWLTFHAFSSIKVLSPSAIVNSTISLIKGVIVAAYAAFLAINPWIALVAALAIIIVCALIFGWAFRWNVFGFLFVKDFLTNASNDELRDGESIRGFSTRHFPGVKPRSYGRLTRDGDELVFAYSPWLIGPKLKSRIPLADLDSSVRKGILMPSVTIENAESDRPHSVVDLRMRFRNHDEAVQQRLQLDSISPNLVLSGMKASWQWLKEQVRRGSSAIADAIDTPISSST